MAATTYWRFGPVPAPVALRECDGLIDAAADSLHGWSVSAWVSGATELPLPCITVARSGDDYVLTAAGQGDEERYEDLPSIVCAFMAELIMAYGRTRPDQLFLHAGAAAVDGRLIVFPAHGKSGKSMLTAQIARRGGRVFSDDVLPIGMQSLKGMALGIEPRLRLPLPPAVGTGMQDWVGRHRRLSNRKMTYLALPREGPGALAPFGEEQAVGAFVLLNRAAGNRPAIEPFPRSEIMKLLIRQYFGTDTPMTALVERFKALTDSVPCYRLSYSGGEQAPDLLFDMAKAA